MIDRSNGSAVRTMKSVAVALMASACWAMALPACAQDVVPPDVMTVSPTGINLSDGSFVFSQTDLKIGSLSLERFYQYALHDADTMPFGLHMGNNFDIYFREHEYTTPKNPTTTTYYRGIVHMGQSASSTYDIAFNVTPVFISPFTDDAYEGILERPSSAYIYTDQNGTVYTFNPAVPVNGAAGITQRVATIAYANGRTLNFVYDAGNHLRTVTSNDGYAIAFDYSGDTVAAACGFDLSQTYVSSATTCSGAALKTSYAYTSGSMTSSTDVLGQTTTYTGAITCIKPPGYATCKVANTYVNAIGGGNRVSQQVMADGSVWQFSGGDPSIKDPDYGSDDGSNFATMLNPDGKYTSFSFTKSSPYSVTDANGKTTQYRFSGGALYQPNAGGLTQGRMLMQAILPEGNEFDATYASSNFNLPLSRTWKAKPGSGLADRTESFTYPSCASPNTRQNCVHPLTYTDPKGAVTNYVYTSYGSIQSEMKPAPSSGAARPLKLYTYVQKFAYVKNSGGALAAAATPIWMLSTETTCQTAAGSNTPACDAAAPRLQTTYQYGADGTADNLLVRGTEVKDLATGVKRLTCFKYDTLGRKISETSPRGTSVCL